MGKMKIVGGPNEEDLRSAFERKQEIIFHVQDDKDADEWWSDDWSTMPIILNKLAKISGNGSYNFEGLVCRSKLVFSGNYDPAKQKGEET